MRFLLNVEWNWTIREKINVLLVSNYSKMLSLSYSKDTTGIVSTEENPSQNQGPELRGLIISTWHDMVLISPQSFFILL